MNGALVNVLFRCDDARCGCQIVLEARMFARDASRIYEYQARSCPNCPHILFGGHRPVGELFSDLPLPGDHSGIAVARRR